MLAISPLRNTHDAIDGGRQQLQSVVVDGGDVHGLQGFSADDNFSDMAFSGAGCSILDGIDFDDLFVGFGDGDDVELPDLEVDPNEIAPDFSVDGSADESVGGAATASSGGVDGLHDGGAGFDAVTEEASSVAAAAFEGGGEDGGRAQLMQAEGMELEQDDDAVANGAPPEDAAAVADGQYQPAQQLEETSPAGSADEMHSDGAGRKPSSSAQAKGPNGKRKVKVDWTPELHRRFVQAVEQLGIDKAVPSRILEIMGIDCLTRHNIASHLQKYRSHRKHLMTREAEAATWSQRRHIYGAAASGKRDPMAGAGAVAASAPWLQAPPTLGFPPAPHPHPSVQPFRPLHVWGHPTVDHAMVHMWPKHLVPPPGGRPSPPWAAAPPPSAAFWHYPRVRRSREVSATTRSFFLCLSVDMLDELSLWGVTPLVPCRECRTH